MILLKERQDPNIPKSTIILEKASKYNTNFAFKPNLKEKRRRQIKDEVRKAKASNQEWPDLK